MATPALILASQSPQRKRLLSQFGLPFTTSPADVDESVLKGESPREYVTRVARAKAAKVAAANPGCVVVAADTPIVVGRRILQKAESYEEAVEMIKLQAGRRVHIPTVVVVANATGKLRHEYVDSWLKIKPLSAAEIEAYLTRQTNYQHLAGAIALENMEHWVNKMHGSVSGIFGLPLYETAKLLKASGIKIP